MTELVLDWHKLVCEFNIFSIENNITALSIIESIPILESCLIVFDNYCKENNIPAAETFTKKLDLSDSLKKLYKNPKYQETLVYFHDAVLDPGYTKRSNRLVNLSLEHRLELYKLIIEKLTDRDLNHTLLQEQTTKFIENMIFNISQLFSGSNVINFRM